VEGLTRAVTLFDGGGSRKGGTGGTDAVASTLGCGFEAKVVDSADDLPRAPHVLRGGDGAGAGAETGAAAGVLPKADHLLVVDAGAGAETGDAAGVLPKADHFLVVDAGAAADASQTETGVSDRGGRNLPPVPRATSIAAVLWESCFTSLATLATELSTAPKLRPRWVKSSCLKRSSRTTSLECSAMKRLAISWSRSTDCILDQSRGKTKACFPSELWNEASVLALRTMFRRRLRPAARSDSLLGVLVRCTATRWRNMLLQAACAPPRTMAAA